VNQVLAARQVTQRELMSTHYPLPSYPLTFWIQDQPCKVPQVTTHTTLGSPEPQPFFQL